MSATRSLATALEERLLVPTYASRWSFAPVLAHRSLALPLQLTGRLRRRAVRFAGDNLDVVEVGRDKLLRPIGSRLFGELPEPAVQVRRALWNPGSLAESGADLVLAEVHRWMAPRFRRAGWLVVPQSVRWHGELANMPPSSASHGLLENLRKMRKQGFSLVQASAAADWEEFYSSMVAPQAVARHGGSAWLPSPRLFAEFSRAGILHLVLKDGQRVAGICTIPKGDTLWLAISGVRHGDPWLLRQGASIATLALAVEWARAQGYRYIDAGRTGPFAHDGLQQFKRKWGLAPVIDPLAHVAAVWIGSPAARRAFVREPVLVENGRQLRVYSGE